MPEGYHEAAEEKHSLTLCSHPEITITFTSALLPSKYMLVTMPLEDVPNTRWNGSEASNFSEQSIDQDESHYFIEVVLLVENTLFRVPRCYFERESDVFRDMFQLPITGDAIPDGYSNKQPLRLDGIKKEDFRQLLRVMFPRHVLVEESLSLAEWTSVLKLSAMWQMDRLREIVVGKMSALTATTEEWMTVLEEVSTLQELSEIRTLAIERLSYNSTLQGVDKILLARKYKVEGWLREGCQELVERRECFSDEEEDRLGWKTVSKLYRLRDRYLRSRDREYMSYWDVRADTETVLEAELKEIGWSGKTHCPQPLFSW